MSSGNAPDQPSDPLSIAIVGNDALIEALPARPIQFAHACRAAGFDVVLPESWGDELVADTTLRKLEERNGSPVVFCACPVVRDRLLASGVELAPLLINTVAPSVAAARYARALYGSRVAHIAYIGDCPAADGPEFDSHHRTADFLSVLRQQGIDLLAQPTVFDAVLPPDRRRFASLPGGCPSPEALWQQSHQRALVGLHAGGEEFAIELAQLLLGKQTVLVDVATSLGCACSGVTRSTPGHNARVAVMSLEPPRATTPVVDPAVLAPLDEPVRALRLPRPPDDPSHPRHSSPSAVGDVRDVGRAPIAVTPPRALRAVERPGPRLERIDAPRWTVRNAPESGAADTRDVATLRRGPTSQGTIVVDRGVREPSVDVATPPKSRAITRPASGSVPTVRLSEPLSFRLPRAYLTRRPHRGAGVASDESTAVAPEVQAITPPSEIDAPTARPDLVLSETRAEEPAVPEQPVRLEPAPAPSSAVVTEPSSPRSRPAVSRPERQDSAPTGRVITPLRAALILAALALLLLALRALL